MPNTVLPTMRIGTGTQWKWYTLILLCFALASGCESSPPAAKPPPPTVTVAHPVSSDVVEWNNYTGRFKAVKIVDVRARVGGYIESVDFKDGAIVKKGDLLFVLDPRPYKAALDQAEGNLVSQEGNLALQDWELARDKRLLKQGAYAQETYEQQLGIERQAKGSKEAAKGAVDAAKLNLEFTEVRAPISGKIGENLVDAGNLISGGSSDSTLLTTIVSLDPIYCYFDVDERTHLKYVRLLQEGKFPRVPGAKFPAWVGLADETGYPHEGYIDFVNNQLNTNTDTITVRAVIPNPHQTLIPGLYARVRVAGSAIIKAILIPDEAIMSDQAQKIVYTVNKKNVVQRRVVKLGQLQAGLRVILSGLATEDRVIIKGTQKVRPGMVASPQEGEIALKSKELVPKALEEFFKGKPTPKPAQKPAQKTGGTPESTGKDGS